MAVEYDLVIIGSTEEAIYAALKAVYLKARVALVLQGFPGQIGAEQAVFSRIYSYLPPAFPEELPLFFPSAHSFDIYELKSWLDQILRFKKEQNSLAILAALGVDVIEENGEFCRLPQLGFLVKQRRLRSRCYLLATGVSPQIPDILGLEESGYLTHVDIFVQGKLLSLPQNLIIIGGNLEGLQLAQGLARLGKKVTLIVERESILPQEDRDVCRIIQAQLASEGIYLITNAQVKQVKRINQQKWLQVENQALETDEIIIAVKNQPNFPGLNLEGVGIKLGKQGILVNDKLQTTNPRIYACGGLLGGYNLANIAYHEADISLKNALFLPIFKPNYSTLPLSILTDPNLARVGLTEVQARRYFAREFIIVKRYFKEVTQAQISGKNTGFCKIILHRSGKILGAHIVGEVAGELIGIFALAMQQKLKISQLEKIYYSPLSYAAIIQQCTREWQKESLKHNQTLSKFINIWYNWQRNINH